MMPFGPKTHTLLNFCGSLCLDKLLPVTKVIHETMLWETNSSKFSLIITIYKN